MPYSFAGTEGLVQNNCISSRFFARMGATRLERNICGAAAYAGVVAALGTSLGAIPEDIVHSRYIILWGSNPVISNPHVWPLILQAKQNGAKVVVVDPFVSATAELSDQHIQLLPGTDTALALALMHVIISEKLQDQDYIDRYTLGFQDLAAHVRKYSPEYASAITGLKPETIVTLAREYAEAKSSVIRLLIGVEKHAGARPPAGASRCCRL